MFLNCSECRLEAFRGLWKPPQASTLLQDGAKCSKSLSPNVVRCHLLLPTFESFCRLPNSCSNFQMILNDLELRLGALGGLWKPPQASTLMLYGEKCSKRLSPNVVRCHLLLPTFESFCRLPKSCSSLQIILKRLRTPFVSIWGPVKASEGLHTNAIRSQMLKDPVPQCVPLSPAIANI